MGEHNLVTTCNFHGLEYLFKMNILVNNLEILITDKASGEEWHCNYDATYIENLTQKTGNYKHFDIFVAMIRSGLLRTSESVSLDLLTFEDLEMLRSRKISKYLSSGGGNNRRYLIVTYAVEFDQICYPLPMEYCGPPDPALLQATIRRLQQELARTKEELELRMNTDEGRRIHFLQKRIDELTEDNAILEEENRHLHKLLNKQKKSGKFCRAVNELEQSVVNERLSHHDLVEQLKSDKTVLIQELEKVKESERCLKEKLHSVHNCRCLHRTGVGDHVPKNANGRQSSGSMKVMYMRGQPSPNRSRLNRKNNTNTRLFDRKSSSEHSAWESPIGDSDKIVRKSRLKTKKSSPASSTASTKFRDLQYTDESEKSRGRTPRRAVKKRGIKSRASSGESMISQLSKKSIERLLKTKDEVHTLEKRIASIEKLIRSRSKTPNKR